jgi:hypothetical protein
LVITKDMEIAALPPEVHKLQPHHPWTDGPAIVMYIAACKFILQLAVANRYSFFCDELYYIACSEHLSWGYVDHPPLIALLAWVIRKVAGESLFALRFLPAVAGAVLVWLTGAIAREMGGKRLAQGLAALGIAVVPMLLTFHYLFTMNAFEPLFWMGCAYLMLLFVTRRRQEYLVWFGVLAGVGMLNKYSIALFLLALCAGILLSPERPLFASAHFWLGVGLAVLIWMPNLQWMATHDFPFVEWQRNMHKAGSLVRVPPWEFIRQQLFLTGMTSVLWVPGIWFFFATRSGKRFRFLGITFVLTVAVLLLVHGKNYYSMPVYAIAIAGGAVAVEEGAGRIRYRKTLVTALVLSMIGTSAILSPLFIPLLPIDKTLEYQARLGLSMPPQEVGVAGNPLSEFFALQFGWEEMTSLVAQVYRSLPERERQHTTILSRAFPAASAINFYGQRYGLPKAISGHVSYWVWGAGSNTTDTVILVGYPFGYGEAVPFCRDSIALAQLHNPYGYAEVNRPIVVCRGFRGNFQLLWDAMKLYE